MPKRGDLHVSAVRPRDTNGTGEATCTGDQSKITPALDLLAPSLGPLRTPPKKVADSGPRLASALGKSSSRGAPTNDGHLPPPKKTVVVSWTRRKPRRILSEDEDELESNESSSTRDPSTKSVEVQPDPRCHPIAGDIQEVNDVDAAQWSEDSASVAQTLVTQSPLAPSPAILDPTPAPACTSDVAEPQPPAADHAYRDDAHSLFSDLDSDFESRSLDRRSQSMGPSDAEYHPSPTPKSSSRSQLLSELKGPAATVSDSKPSGANDSVKITFARTPNYTPYLRLLVNDAPQKGGRATSNDVAIAFVYYVHIAAPTARAQMSKSSARTMDCPVKDGPQA